MGEELNLINGDCLEEMKGIEDNTIDLLFCDLPFGCTSCKWDCPIDLSLFWKQINRICKINCPMFFCCNSKFGNTLINSNPKHFRYELIWIKSSPVGFLLAKKLPMKKHELIYVFYRKLPYYDLSSHKHKFLGERESNRKGKKDGVDNKGVWKNRSKSGKETSNKYDPPLPTSIIKDIDEKYQNKGGLYSKVSRNGLVKSETHYDPPLPNTLLEFKSERGKHPTQKPVTLIEWILKYYSREGDTILDPTMGSGSSGVACNNMNRKYIGIELDETIFKNAEKRLKKI